jgi:hypothetical protein
LPPQHDTDELLELGSEVGPLKRRSTLLRFLARNPDLVNTPQTPEEAYRQYWMDSLDHDKKTIKDFISGPSMGMGNQRKLEATLCSSELIGLTKFAIETCEMLSRSKITDLKWLSKGDIGMEVCIIPITEIFRLI